MKDTKERVRVEYTCVHCETKGAITVSDDDDGELRLKAIDVVRHGHCPRCIERTADVHLTIISVEMLPILGKILRELDQPSAPDKLIGKIVDSLQNKTHGEVIMIARDIRLWAAKRLAERLDRIGCETRTEIK